MSLSLLVRSNPLLEPDLPSQGSISVAVLGGRIYFEEVQYITEVQSGSIGVTVVECILSLRHGGIQLVAAEQRLCPSHFGLRQYMTEPIGMLPDESLFIHFLNLNESLGPLHSQ